MPLSIFDIRIHEAGPKKCIVTGSIGHISVRDEAELSFDISHLNLLAADVRAPAHRPQDLHLLSDYLYQVLFPPRVRDLWIRNRDTDNSLALRLRIDDPVLTVLPWELVLAPERDTERGLVDLNYTVPFIRAGFSARTVAPRQPPPPLGVLVVTALPNGVPALDIDGELAELQRLLAPLVARGVVQPLEVLANPTLRELDERLHAQRVDLLHYIGHGKLNSQSGVLLLRDEAGNDPCEESALKVGSLFGDASVSMVVLNACDTASVMPAKNFRGVAQEISRVGVPVVVAMQFAMPDTVAAVKFTGGFYNALARGETIAQAVSGGRRVTAQKTTFDRRHWAAPVLFLTGEDRALFREDASAQPVSPKGGINVNICGGTVIMGGIVFSGNSTQPDNPEPSPRAAINPATSASRRARLVEARRLAETSPHQASLMRLIEAIGAVLGQSSRFDIGAFDDLLIEARNARAPEVYRQILLDISNDPAAPEEAKRTARTRLKSL